MKKIQPGIFRKRSFQDYLLLGGLAAGTQATVVSTFNEIQRAIENQQYSPAVYDYIHSAIPSTAVAGMLLLAGKVLLDVGYSQAKELMGNHVKFADIKVKRTLSDILALFGTAYGTAKTAAIQGEFFFNTIQNHVLAIEKYVGQVGYTTLECIVPFAAAGVAIWGGSELMKGLMQYQIAKNKNIPKTN